MNTRLRKAAAVMLLGLMSLMLAVYPALALPAPAPVVKSCCVKGHCCGMACCAAKKGSPQSAPVPAAPGPQTQLQVMVASILLRTPLPESFTRAVPAVRIPSLPVAVPLFQRDCSYLI